MSKLFKTVAKIAPIALPFIAPGIGTAIGAGLGATGATASALGSGLIGAGLGAASGGGLKSALLGGATGGLGGYLSGGGFNNLLGSAAGTTLDKATGVAGAQGPTMGTGITGAVTRNVPSLGSLAGSGSQTALGGNRLMSALSGINQYQTQDDIEKQMIAQQRRAQQVLNPFLQTGTQAQKQLSGRLEEGFDPSSIENDPSYQFRQREGQQALERSLAAQGLGQSGAALRAAQELGQGMASNEYQNAYNRWLQQNQQLGGVGGTGLQAAGGLGNVYTNLGNIGAGASAAKANVLSGTLSDILRGSGSIIGYDENGQPIFRG